MDSNGSNSNPPNKSSGPPPPHPMPLCDREAWKREMMQAFWQKQMLNIQVAEEFKSQLQFPLARIRRIIKSSGKAKILSAETPILMAKSCDLFIQLLALRAWMQSQENNRCVVQSRDLAKEILENDAFDFLTDVLPIDLIDACTKDAQKKNVANVATEKQVSLPYDCDYEEGNAISMIAGNQSAMSYGAAMGNPIINNTEGNDLNVFGGNQAPLSHAAGFNKNQMMNMNVRTSNQQHPQTYMIQQQVMPLDQFPHNFPPQVNLAKDTFN